ncbi:hypothetical protein [Sorangium sp. So ce854]|uniref:hypothetical protein n=1 Tax=Sorangium sp. So ce854 TaxID=3133322 RepID=UPI003F5FAE35
MAAICAATLVACMGQGDDETQPGETQPGEPQPEEMGFVTVQWAIEDRTEADQCKAYGAQAVELLLINTENNQVTRQVVPCERFDTSVQVTADDYVGTITLLDGNGKAVSEPLPVGPFEVSGEEQTTRRVSFPAADQQRERGTHRERGGQRDRESQRDRRR